MLRLLAIVGMETVRLLFLCYSLTWTTTRGLAWAQQPSIDHPLWARRPPPPPPQPETLATFDLRVPADYPIFIENMRRIFSEKGQDGKDVKLCGMRKMSDTIPTPRYGYIDIQASAVTVTLAIDRTNIYVLGYRDIFNRNDRVFFFKDEYDNAKDLFPDVKGNNRIKLDYTAQYSSIGGDRTKIPIGIFDLETSITNIYGKVSNDKAFNQHQRRFFIIALQVISEATRFKYISDEIPTNAYESYTPDAKAVALENSWGTLSASFYKNVNTECIIKPAISILVHGKPWTFNTVEELAQVIGLLKAKGRSLSTNDDEDDHYGGGVAVASS